MTKTVRDNPPGQAGTGERGYFARFFGFAFGVYGSGGLLSIVRSRSSVRFFAWPAGIKSSLAISDARSACFDFSAFIFTSESRVSL
jgi:hypothetical protein